MVECPSCGSGVERFDAFCHSCGAEIEGVASETGRLTAGRVILYAATVVILASVVLPWIVVDGSETLSGFQASGALVLLLGILFGVLSYGQWRPRDKAVVAAIGLLVAVVGLYTHASPFPQAYSWSADYPDAVAPGIGAYFAIAGGVGLVTAANVDYGRR